MPTRRTTKEQKKLKGTNPGPRDADANVVDFPKLKKIPKAPDWLPEGAKAEWARTGELLRGTVDLTVATLETLAMYAQLKSEVMENAQKGIRTPTADRVELRHMREYLFGPGNSGGALTPRTGGNKNPFARNGVARNRD